MPTFVPPVTDGNLIGDPNDPSWSFFRHFGAWAQGLTVWRDSQGVWHESTTPYLGGATTTTHDWDQSSYTSPDEGLATAQRVYLGGHEHTITQQEADDLTAAGYGARINIADVEGHWVNEDIARMSNRVASVGVGGEVPVPLTVDSEQRIVGALQAPSGSSSGSRRDFWVHDSVTGWTDYRFKTRIDPPSYGAAYTPQAGIVLRHQFSAGKWRGVTINNNIFFVVPFINVGVWEHNVDGTGFVNRQFGWPQADMVGLPYEFEGTLIGNVVTISTYPKNGTADPNSSRYTKVINLDTDAGNAAAVPTPTGPGDGGVILAHSSADAIGASRVGLTRWQRLN